MPMKHDQTIFNNITNSDPKNIPVFIYKILATQFLLPFQCSLITRCLKVFFLNALKQLNIYFSFFIW